MSLLDAEQTARYVESLTASVQALEADLAATRAKLREAETARLAEVVKHGNAVMREQAQQRKLREAQARIAALEQERKRFAGVLATVTAFGYTPICEDPEHTQHSCMLCTATWLLGELHPQNGCLAQADARGREEER